MTSSLNPNAKEFTPGIQKHIMWPRRAPSPPLLPSPLQSALWHHQQDVCRIFQSPLDLQPDVLPKFCARLACVQVQSTVTVSYCDPPPVWLFDCLSERLTDCLSACMNMSVCFTVWTPDCLSVRASVRLPVYLSEHVCLPVCGHSLNVNQPRGVSCVHFKFRTNCFLLQSAPTHILSFYLHFYKNLKTNFVFRFYLEFRASVIWFVVGLIQF